MDSTLFDNSTSSSSSSSASASMKKGSIFKTRSAGVAKEGKRRHALYRHKWSDSDPNNSNSGSKDSQKSKILCVDSTLLPTTSKSKSALADSSSAASSSSSSSSSPFAFDDSTITRVVTVTPSPFDDSNDCTARVRCDKKAKPFYTVIKNVKKAHQIQESGEFQEFNDDVDYILDTLRSNNPITTRCLSALRLASKCTIPAFRMHVRAHGTVAKFFKALQDATLDPSLALCAAAVMFVLSQDRLAMDLDKDCLELMLSLLECDEGRGATSSGGEVSCGGEAELMKNREKVRQICADIQSQGHAEHLDLAQIGAAQLAMETLLSLTSKRAGEWFKEELRKLGGLEHICKSIGECCRRLDLSSSSSSSSNERIKWEGKLDVLQKVDRCLKVLENVSYMNEENQVYLLKYNDGELVKTLAGIFDSCSRAVLNSASNVVLRDCLLAIIKVLINLTHYFNSESFGAASIGGQSGLMESSVRLLLNAASGFPEGKSFDAMVLVLILLINLVERCEENKSRLAELRLSDKDEDEEEGFSDGFEPLIRLFYEQERLAVREEQKTDAILDGEKMEEEEEEGQEKKQQQQQQQKQQQQVEAKATKSREEFVEETVSKLLQKAGRHMEHTLVGAYVVLLLGNLVMGSEEYEERARLLLPDGKFEKMVAVLQKFYNFMNLTASNEISSCGMAATERVLRFLKVSDEKYS